jgi:hypothetical protein
MQAVYNSQIRVLQLDAGLSTGVTNNCYRVERVSFPYY